MFEIVPSQWMKKCFEEIDFAFTDFQKATLIWNAPGRLRQEIFDALEELAEDTRDRGPHPIKTIRKLMEMPNAICLVGNHEFMAMKCLEFLMKEI